MKCLGTLELANLKENGADPSNYSNTEVGIYKSKKQKILKLSLFFSGENLFSWSRSCFLFLFLVKILFSFFFLGRKRFFFLFILNLTFSLVKGVFSFSFYLKSLKNSHL